MLSTLEHQVWSPGRRRLVSSASLSFLIRRYSAWCPHGLDVMWQCAGACQQTILCQSFEVHWDKVKYPCYCDGAQWSHQLLRVHWVPTRQFSTQQVYWLSVVKPEPCCSQMCRQACHRQQTVYTKQSRTRCITISQVQIQNFRKGKRGQSSTQCLATGTSQAKRELTAKIMSLLPSKLYVSPILSPNEK